jgi:hypothetical protein
MIVEAEPQRAVRDGRDTPVREESLQRYKEGIMSEKPERREFQNSGSGKKSG